MNLERLFVSWLIENSMGTLSILLLGLLWWSWKGKIKKVFALAEIDFSKCNTEKTDAIDELKRLKVVVTNLGERMLNMNDIEKHCEIRHVKHLTRDETYNSFMTKENSQLMFNGVENTLKMIMEEIKGLRSDMKEMWQRIK